MKKYVIYSVLMVSVLNANTLIDYNEKFSLLKTEKEEFKIEKKQFEEDLSKREEDLKKKILESKEVLTKIEESRKELKKEETEIEKEERKRQNQKEDDIIEIYSKMKPQAIADVFSILIKEDKEMAKRLFVKFPKKISRVVLSKMEPKDSAKITIEVLNKKEK